MWELKSYKGKIEGFLNERTRNKDVVIASQQKEIDFLKKRNNLKDSIIYVYKRDSTILNESLIQFKRSARQEKAKKIGIGLSVIPVALASFLLAWYLPH